MFGVNETNRLSPFAILIEKTEKLIELDNKFSSLQSRKRTQNEGEDKESWDNICVDIGTTHASTVILSEYLVGLNVNEINQVLIELLTVKVRNMSALVMMITRLWL